MEQEPELLLCERCRKVALRYFDEAASADRRLGLLGRLALAAGDTLELFEDVVPEFGAAIEDYLERRALLEHVALDRSMPEIAEDDWRHSEVERLRRTFARARERDDWPSQKKMQSTPPQQSSLEDSDTNLV